MTLEQKIDILLSKYPKDASRHERPNHITMILTTYEDYSALTSKMHETLDTVIERIMKNDKDANGNLDSM